jgi:hypothetical protein
LVVRFERGLRGREGIEAMTLDLVRVIFPRFERRRCRRNRFVGELRKGGGAPLRVS